MDCNSSKKGESLIGNMDARVWAKEMHKRFPQISESDLIGWCANMIMTGHDVAYRRKCLDVAADIVSEIKAQCTKVGKRYTIRRIHGKDCSYSEGFADGRSCTIVDINEAIQQMIDEINPSDEN